MQTRGVFVPETEAEARERYERLGPVAQTVVRETAKGMAFDREEYDERVTPEVVARVHDALFASLLSVTVGTADEFEAWMDDHDGDAVVVGSENVENVAWHAPPFADAVAATFQDEEDAAVETLRRQAFGRIYRDRLHGES
ncbi:MAG TPA: DUF5809 family protein [Halobacteriales archaeon]|nr:DUF5809 family protein [Halobacteriales archaeon]